MNHAACRAHDIYAMLSLWLLKLGVRDWEQYGTITRLLQVHRSDLAKPLLILADHRFRNPC
jgi:hypothetical protein